MGLAIISQQKARDNPRFLEITIIANRRIDAVTLSALTSDPAGATYLNDFVPYFAVIPAQTTRDLLDRQTADEHIT